MVRNAFGLTCALVLSLWEHTPLVLVRDVQDELLERAPQVSQADFQELPPANTRRASSPGEPEGLLAAFEQNYPGDGFRAALLLLDVLGFVTLARQVLQFAASSLSWNKKRAGSLAEVLRRIDAECQTSTNPMEEIEKLQRRLEEQRDKATVALRELASERKARQQIFEEGAELCTQLAEARKQLVELGSSLRSQKEQNAVQAKRLQQALHERSTAENTLRDVEAKLHEHLQSNEVQQTRSVREMQELRDQLAAMELLHEQERHQKVQVEKTLFSKDLLEPVEEAKSPTKRDTIQFALGRNSKSSNVLALARKLEANIVSEQASLQLPLPQGPAIFSLGTPPTSPELATLMQGCFGFAAQLDLPAADSSPVLGEESSPGSIAETLVNLDGLKESQGQSEVRNQIRARSPNTQMREKMAEMRSRLDGLSQPADLGTSSPSAIKEPRSDFRARSPNTQMREKMAKMRSRFDGASQPADLGTSSPSAKKEPSTDAAGAAAEDSVTILASASAALQDMAGLKEPLEQPVGVLRSEIRVRSPNTQMREMMPKEQVSVQPVTLESNGENPIDQIKATQTPPKSPVHHFAKLLCPPNGESAPLSSRSRASSCDSASASTSSLATISAYAGLSARSRASSEGRLCMPPNAKPVEGETMLRMGPSGSPRIERPKRRMPEIPELPPLSTLSNLYSRCIS